MKIRKLLLTGTALILVASIVGLTYMWFFKEKKLTVVEGNAAIIDLVTCNEETISFDNILPGEPIDLTVNPIWYRGSRDAIVQFRLVGQGKLKPGSDTHKDWLALKQSNPTILDSDYVYDGTVYQMTDKRFNEVLSLKDTKKLTQLYPLYQSTHDPNTFYVYMKPDDTMVFNLLALVSLKFTGELGGGMQGSPSRQFEQQSVYTATGVKVTAVQITPDAIKDVMGETALKDVEKMINENYFTPGAEWKYTP